MPYRPQLSNAQCAPTFTVNARDENGTTVATAIAAERPLTIYVDKREIVTLMTLGAAPEALAVAKQDYKLSEPEQQQLLQIESQ